MVSNERRRSSVSAAPETDDDGFDELLASIGFGRWQMVSVVMVLIIAALMPVHMVGMPLIAPPVPFRCYGRPPTMWNQSAETANDRVTESLGAHSLNKTYFNEKCLNSLEQAGDALSLWPNNSIATGMESCPFIEYDRSIFTSSIVSDFHLVCERFDQQALYQIMYTVGGVVGNIIGSQIGDKCGRRKGVQMGAVLYLGAVLAIAFVPLYEVILLMRFVICFAITSALVTSFNMVVEGTPPTARTLVGMLVGLPYSLTITIFAAVGYFMSTWQSLTLVFSTPVLVIIPLSFVVDESPRWLLQQGRTKEAYAILQKAIRINKSEVKDDLSSVVEKIAQRRKQKHPNDASKGMSFSAKCRAALQQMAEYFRSPGMRIIIIISPLIFFFQNFAYLGLSINANNFTSEDPFLYVGLTGVMDAVAILLSTPATVFLGRRVMVGGELLVGGVLLLLELVIPAEHAWVKWVLVMVGLMLVAGSFQVSFVYAPELFPTLARARGFAFVNMVGNIGAMCAPLITTNLASIKAWAPGVVFGCSGILCSLMVPLLPETRNKPLPENLQDVDDRWRASKIKFTSKGDGIVNVAYKYNPEHEGSLVNNGTVSRSGAEEES